jgi:AhpD family alkylhydroperoxidase
MSHAFPIHVPTGPSKALRLAPLDTQPSLLLRAFNWLLRARLGKVITPSRVIYARFPTLLWRQLPLYALAESGLSVGHDLRFLIEVRVSRLNHCTFCEDLHRKAAQISKASRKKLAALDDFETNDAFDERERIALRYVSEIAQHNTVQDATFERLRANFSEREIIEITWLQAFTTYLNRMAVPLGIGSDGFCGLS